MSANRGGNSLVVGGDGHVDFSQRPGSPLRDVHHHRLPEQIGERLSGQALCAVASGDDGSEAHAAL